MLKYRRIQKFKTNDEAHKMTTYTKEVEILMKKYCDSLAENARRRYAAIEVLKLGYGGQKYISEILKIDPETILKGIKELEDESSLEVERIRAKGGGRKKNN
jgi:hypothetical protein